MKTNILQATMLTVCCIIFFCGIYTVVIWGIGQLSVNKGEGEMIYYKTSKGLTEYGFANVGQAFTADQYFWSRPSAVKYDASGSGGSNKGPSNPDYLKQVNAAIDNFLAHNPEVKKSDIPAELVTASGSGLDPHISPQSAMIQVARIARVRNISKEELKILINNHIEKPFLGMFGPEKINVLRLNIALDKLK